MRAEIMTFIESICFARVYAEAIGLAPSNSVTQYEKDITANELKHMADLAPNWTQSQKDVYKLLVDITKENS